MKVQLIRTSHIVLCDLLMHATWLHVKVKACKAAYKPSGSSGRKEYFYSPLDEMLVHQRVTPCIKLASTHLYTWVERSTVRVKCLAQEHNTMSLARARTKTSCSPVERTNHEATVSPTRLHGLQRYDWRISST